LAGLQQLQLAPSKQLIACSTALVFFANLQSVQNRHTFAKFRVRGRSPTLWQQPSGNAPRWVRTGRQVGYATAMPLSFATPPEQGR